MAVLKAEISLYRSGEEKPLDRYKARVKVAEESKLFSSFNKHVIEFLGLNEQAKKYGLGSFDLKLYRLARINDKAENYAISTQQQLELEMPVLLDTDGKSELNAHFNACQKKRGAGVKGVKTLEAFFAKGVAQSLSKSSSSILTAANDDEQDQYEGADAIVSEKCVERAHPLAEKLNRLIKEEKIPEECLFYKYLDDTTSFAMIDSSKASDFHWDHEVCYTTDSGIIKPHLQSFHVFASHPKADINYLVSSDQVQVIGVSLAMDGTALKPGLEFDTRQKRIIGLTYKVDWNYVCVPKPEEIKAN
ncbi:hypothetical protein ACROYT_G035430 [Oculina patagonica]